MKSCMTWLAIIGLAVGTVGCGPAQTPMPAGSSANTTPVLGSPGDLEAGATTSGMETPTTTDSPTTDDRTDNDTSTDNTATDGPELP